MRAVSKILFAIGISVLLISVVRCHKDPKEEGLRISTDASQVNNTASPFFDFSLKVESKMPPSGVKIEYMVKGEADNVVYYQNQTTSTASQKLLTIYSLPRQIMCVCTVVATSQTKTTNTATISFRVGYK